MKGHKLDLTHPFLIFIEVISALTKGGVSLAESAASLAGIVTAATFYCLPLFFRKGNTSDTTA